MDGEQFCPLDPTILNHGRNRHGRNIGLSFVKSIEQHLLNPGNCVHPPLKELKISLADSPVNDCSPMLLACAQGNVALVKRLINRWGVDYRASATYYHLGADGEVPYPRWSLLDRKIEKATPLFVAALHGHVHLVRYLVGIGAYVSAKTSSSCKKYDSITPLIGALIPIDENSYHRYIQSRRIRERKSAVAQLLLDSGANLSTHGDLLWKLPLSNSNTTTIRALINHGVDVNQRHTSYREDGDTVLHHWASNPLSQLMETRSEEESPLVVIKILVERGADLSALDCYGFTPILRAAHAFSAHCSHEHFSILDYLLERGEISRQDKIDAMELIGAKILMSSENAHLFEKGFYYWRQALLLREMETMESGPLYKTAMQRKTGLSTEWITREQLEQVIQHPIEFPVQAFLVQLRIYSSKGWWAVLCFVDDFLKCHVYRRLQQHRRFDDLLGMLWAIFELQPLDEIKEYSLLNSIQEIVRIISNLRTDDPISKTEAIATTLELVLSSEPFHLHIDQEAYRRTLLDFIKMIAGHQLNDGIKRLLLTLLQRSENESCLLSSSLLIQACQTGVYNLSTIRLLLECGADPNAADYDGNGPLHHLFMDRNVFCGCLLRLLLDNGAQLDRVNEAGKTASALWAKSNQYPGDSPQSVPNLTCLCARVVCTHQIPFTVETLPVSLHKFADTH